MRGRQSLSAGWRRFAASDPGLLRLLAGLRTVAAIALALVVLALAGVQPTVLVAGAMAAMVASFAVTEPLPRQHAVTLALGLPTACAAVTAGTLLAPHRILADVVFVGVIFAAVYGRRYGRRATSLGLIGFQMFFVAQFIQATAQLLPTLYAVLCTAFGCAALARFGLVRSTPDGILRRLLHAYRTRLLDLVRASRDAAAEEARAPAGAPAPELADALRKRVDRLHACALTLQNRIPDALPESEAGALSRRVAEADVAAQRLAALLLVLPERIAQGGEPTQGAREARAGAARELVAALDTLASLIGASREGGPERFGDGDLKGLEDVLALRDEEPRAGLPPALGETLRAAGELAGAAFAVRIASGTDAEGATGDATERVREELSVEDLSLEAGSEGREDGAGDQERGLRRPTTRAACQVAIGSALAIAGGELISEQRWYWAVLTCWVVFLNTSSTGEILVKGGRRLAGTLVGVVFGLGLTALVTGHVGLVLALVLLCVFAMFYVAPVSYTLMSFFVTTMLGLLYTLLHTYTTSVMLVRIEETALGAACGLVAALVVLPVSTRDRTDAELAATLDELRATLAACVDGRGDPDAVAARALALDTALDALHRSTVPLTHPATPLRERRGTTAYALGLVDSCAYHVRVLASWAQQRGPERPFDPALESAAARVGANLLALSLALRPAAPDEEAAPRTLEAPAERLPAPELARSVGARRHLHRLDERVLGLGEPLGVARHERAPAPGA
ncbi:FUSC family protein [Streptomyces sp. NPDC001941]|uniref:FUSC family protein n=1 Tax=Streptomyces sp. NPDC001941 TaxID=3154659 RepID=UPI00331A4AC7